MPYTSEWPAVSEPAAAPSGVGPETIRMDLDGESWSAARAGRRDRAARSVSAHGLTACPPEHALRDQTLEEGRAAAGRAGRGRLDNAGSVSEYPRLHWLRA
jgi:hypothetical protein